MRQYTKFLACQALAVAMGQQVVMQVVVLADMEDIEKAEKYKQIWYNWD